jgi:hypothetical protein
VSNGGADGTLPEQRRRRSIFRDDAAAAEAPSSWVLPGEDLGEAPAPPEGAEPDGAARSIFRSGGDRTEPDGGGVR